MGRSSRGVTGIKLSSNDELTGALRVVEGAKILLMTEFGYGKRVEYTEFSPHGRGTGGQRVYTINEKTGEIVGTISVSDTDEVMCITSQGKTLRAGASGISVMGRSAQGVRILNIDSPDMVIGVDCVVKEDEGTPILPEQVPGEISVGGVNSAEDVPAEGVVDSVDAEETQYDESETEG